LALTTIMNSQTSMANTQATMATNMATLSETVAKALTRLEVLDTMNNQTKYNHTDHETRLRVLESGMTRFRATVTTVATLAGFAAGVLGHFIGKH